MPKTDRKRIKAQLEADVAKYHNRFKITMENANLLESKAQEAEQTLLRFRGLTEGVTFVKNALMQRMKSYQETPDANTVAMEELRNVLALCQNIEQQAATQSVRQEGVIQAVRGSVEALKQSADESARMARTKEAQLSKADKSPIATPEQEPPKTSSKKKAKKTAKKKAAKKKTAKKTAKKRAKKSSK